MAKLGKADVCLLLEGTYPYIPGGVSSWTHELIRKQDHLTFHVVALVPRDAKTDPVYNIPSNVLSVTNVYLQDLPEGVETFAEYSRRIVRELRTPLSNLHNHKATLEDFRTIIRNLEPYKDKLGSQVLLNGTDTWNMLVSMYEETYNESSFLDYFWSWRAVISSMYSVILAQLPEASVYHSMSTGYAGLMAARAKVETGRPAIVTEHGIYTNERRIEVASADWLEETASKILTIDKTRQNLRDLWINTFTNYSRICYEACDRIITLFEGNQLTQVVDGGDPAKMEIIPNGIDIARFSAIARKAKDAPVIALIGRVVPIKDTKSFIRACSLLRDYVPGIKAYIMGPTDEDRDYYNECQAMIDHMGLRETVIFTGEVKIDEYMAEIDVLVLTSISEAQPLVILEAGAVGIPTVATDVGACREMILGKSSEDPWLGEGGVVAPLSNPKAIADGVYGLIADQERYRKASDTMRERVKKYYNMQDQYQAYKDLYASFM